MRRVLAALALAALGACQSVHTVRLQDETVHVGPGLRPIAAVQAHASSLYVLFIPIPGVSLDQVVNRLAIVQAKNLGADKLAQLDFHIDSTIGFWCFWKLLCHREAWAKGIAVQVEGPAVDPKADEGPEPRTP